MSTASPSHCHSLLISLCQILGQSKCFLPLQVQDIVVTKQELGLSTNEPTEPFYYSNFDGILGMAYPSLAEGSGLTVMQNMVQQGQLTEPIFSFYFSR